MRHVHADTFLGFHASTCRERAPVGIKMSIFEVGGTA